jgi:hypothetical protein
VEAVQTWLAAAGIESGPVFRSVPCGGRLQPRPLRGADVALIVKRRAAQAGLDPAEFSGHSLRAGFVTSAAETGASILKIQEVSRHLLDRGATGRHRLLRSDLALAAANAAQASEAGRVMAKDKDGPPIAGYPERNFENDLPPFDPNPERKWDEGGQKWMRQFIDDLKARIEQEQARRIRERDRGS